MTGLSINMKYVLQRDRRFEKRRRKEHGKKVYARYQRDAVDDASAYLL
jgi:hypothetical protein